MNKKLRGSYHVDGRRSLTVSTEADGKLVDVGFRMVHDSAYRVDRGCGWGHVPRDARVAYRFSRGPAVRFGSLGFRLAFDREGQ